VKADIWEERPATAYFGVEAVEFIKKGRFPVLF
jgi:hypothetical protein